MLNINAINTFELSKVPSRMNVHRSNFADQLSIMKADRLLQTTRQYNNWQKIRQNDPSRAVKIADLLLERHAFIEGSAPRDENGRTRFDHLTDRLKSEGIHLYKSHQFKNPIFLKSNALSMPGGHISDGVMKTPVTNVDPTVKNLRSRFENKDCLEFLAGILEESGIAYYGEKGMANTLVAKARNEGKNTNTYLTGEGITHALCKNPVTIHVKSNSSDSFEEIWNKIKPHMKKDAILSFSSQSFGHTGIIEKVADRLTFLNSSGIKGKPKTYKVLAEEPKHEIRTWIQRAQRQKAFLDITIGAIDSKLASQFDNPSLARRVAPDRNPSLLTSQIVAKDMYETG